MGTCGQDIHRPFVEAEFADETDPCLFGRAERFQRSAIGGEFAQQIMIGLRLRVELGEICRPIIGAREDALGLDRLRRLAFADIALAPRHEDSHLVPQRLF